MPAPRSNNPSVHEDLQRVNTPQQMARGYALNSFERPTMGMVGRDRTAGSDWYLLGKSLSQLGSAWDLASKVWIDRWKERSIAEGRQLWTNTEEENQNRERFKDFTEKNPQYANDNPWVKVGFEQSRMRTLGLDMHTGLQKMMMEGNLYNEKDQSKVQAAVDSFIANYRKQWGLETYEDPITMAEHFSPMQARAKESIMGAWVETQRANRMEELKNQVVAEMSGLLETGNVNGAMAALEEAQKNGLLNRFAPDVALGAIKVAFDKTKNSKYLEMMKSFAVNGTKLIDTPEGAAFYKNSHDYLINEGRKNASWAHTQMMWARQEMQYNGSAKISAEIDWNSPDALEQFNQKFHKMYPKATEADYMHTLNAARQYNDQLVKAESYYWTTTGGKRESMELIEAIVGSSADSAEAAKTTMNYALMMNNPFMYNKGQEMFNAAINGKDNIIAQENKAIDDALRMEKPAIDQDVAKVFAEASTGLGVDKLNKQNTTIAKNQMMLELKARTKEQYRLLEERYVYENGKKPTGMDRVNMQKQAITQARTDTFGNEKKVDEYVRLINPAKASLFHLADPSTSQDEVKRIGHFENALNAALDRPDYFLTRSGMNDGLARKLFTLNKGEAPTSPEQVMNILMNTDKSFGIEGFTVNGKEIEVDFGEHLSWRSTAEERLNRLRMMFKGYTFRARKSENAGNLIYNYD